MDVKSGIKTTEFWCSIAACVGAVAAAVAGVLPAEWAAILTTVSTTAYAISRGITKV